MKKPLRIALVLGTWAVVTWLFRDRLLRIARPDHRPVPRIAAPQPTAKPVPAGSVAPPSEPGRAGQDDLTEIKGIGPVYRGRLADFGITTFADLAAANAKQVAEAIDAAESLIDDWIDQARKLES